MVSTRLKNIKSNWIISWGRNVVFVCSKTFCKDNSWTNGILQSWGSLGGSNFKNTSSMSSCQCSERMETAWGFPPKKIGGRKSEYSPLKGQSMKITPPGVGTTYEFSHQTKEYQSWTWIPDVMLLQTYWVRKGPFKRCKRGHLLGIYGCFQK